MALAALGDPARFRDPLVGAIESPRLRSTQVHSEAFVIMLHAVAEFAIRTV